MAFAPISFNRSSGIGEGVNDAAQNFLRAFQLRQQRKLQEQQAATQQQQATLQTQAMQREAQMAPLREALIRGQAFQQGIKPAETAADTTFNLPTFNTVGAPVVNAPAFTVGASERYVPLGGGQLPIANVADATRPALQERGGFVFDTLDNPTARARNQHAADLNAELEQRRDAARQQLQALYTREALAGQRQNSQNQFTAGQNALSRANARDVASANRQNSRDVAAIRSGNTNGLQRPQEFNQKAALVTPRAVEAAKEIDAMGNPTSSLPSRMAQHIPFVGQYFIPDEQQQLQQAGNVLATAILRLESGAAVSKQEAESYAKQFLPQPGDSQEVLAQKKRARDLAVEQLQAAARPVTARQQAQGTTAPGSFGGYSPDNPFAPRP